MVRTLISPKVAMICLPRFQENLSDKIVARPCLDFLILLEMIEAAKIASFMAH